MKKNYIAPELDVTYDEEEYIIATSEPHIEYQGSNKDGGPTKAESKLYDYNDDFGIDWQ